ncbi:tRNA (adenosine(37)-N6)-threonylcarbamoyltransferase complex dimerization subunit type 1 TsaB [Wolbachia pipientis]|uniref:tRNA (Adenosine(37)-N6)-threonylcarbamoyltransferase complex dimerization subunit type 1 TsaB n=1 Tax=Wolbachia pipientis TaxID=955 RepID=A0A1E7QKM6_WOLPI|nr:tRNA (adenosine(37)-N6)-threonylcarbamoyltransferase complex dimerization subunit type 1 TsaB [Wolbachia pipientis]OEY86957.1 tRNA (adenosine(37)-N6)-threonylcarbamoyltransferase complex dimerization subunit type 1 TsaB [Wolbachia pipientis]
MSILAIDTIGSYSSIAIIDYNGNYFIEHNIVANNHAESFFSVLDTLFDKYGYNYDKIDHLVVVTGPGSFTGIRVGLSAATGISIATNKPLYGISALEAQAYAISSLKKGSKENIRSTIKSSKEIYTQLFDSSLLQLSEPEVINEDYLALSALDARHAGLLVLYRLKNRQKLNDAKALYLSRPKMY